MSISGWCSGGCDTPHMIWATASAKLIAAIPKSVRLIAQFGNGFDNVDIEAAYAAGILMQFAINLLNCGGIAELIVLGTATIAISALAQQMGVAQRLVVHEHVLHALLALRLAAEADEGFRFEGEFDSLFITTKVVTGIKTCKPQDLVG